MDFKDLTYIIAAASELNFSRAAEKLFVAQPTLSQTVSKLEKRAGCKLFERMQYGLCLTDEGKRFVEIARKILDLKEDLDRDMHNIRHGQTGQIHLGISYTFSSFLLPKVLPNFSNDYPAVEIIIHTETSSVLERMMLDGSLDVAVIVELEKHKSLNYEVLFYEQVLLAVSPDNPLAKNGLPQKGEDWPYLEPEMLTNQRFILSQDKMRLRQSADTFFQAEGIIPEIVVTTASIPTAMRLAAHNVGIAFIPASHAAKDVAPPAPSYFSTASTLTDWAVSIAHRKDKDAGILSCFTQAFKNAM